MSSYYYLPGLEGSDVASQDELERRLMARVEQEAARRLRPVRLKVELTDDGSHHAGNSAAPNSMDAAAAAAVAAADEGSFSSSQAGGSNRNHSSFTTQATNGGRESSPTGGASGGSQTSNILPTHTLRRIVGHLHLRKTISKANPFRAVRALSHMAEGSTSGSTVFYEDALLVIGTELLDLHLTTADGMESGDEDTSPSGSSHSVTERSGHSFMGPAGLRAAKGRDLRSRVAGHAVLRENLGPQSVTALQNPYSLSVSYAQILSVQQQGEELTVHYAHSVAAKQQGELHFTLAAASQQEAEKIADDIRKYLCRYLQALLLLQNNYRLDATCSVRLVSLTAPGSSGGSRSSGSSGAAEHVVAHSPGWNSTILMPALQGSRLRMYLATPIGGAHADVTPELLDEYCQDGEASFWVKAQRERSRQMPQSPSDSCCQRPASSGPGQHQQRDSNGDTSPNSEQRQDSFSTVPSQASKSQGSRQNLMETISEISLQRESAALEQEDEPGADHEVQLFVKARASSAPWSASPASPSQPGGVSYWLCLALVAAVTAIAWRMVDNSNRQLLLGALLGLVVMPMTTSWVVAAFERTPLLKQSDGSWEVTLVAAHPVHDLTMDDHGAWSEEGQVGEQELSRRQTIEQPSQAAGADDGPWGRFTADEERRFLEGTQGDRKEALRRLHITAEWREKLRLQDILEQPQPAFDFAKELYSHGIAGFTKSGQPVWVDKIAEFKQGYSKLKASEFTTDDLYRHAAFCEEHLFRVVAPEAYPLGQRLEVVDLAGMSFRDIGSGWFSWCKALGMTLQEHYPERMSRCFVINAPTFFSLLWRALDPLLEEGVKKKVSVVAAGSSPLELFREEMESDDDILAEWGGKKNKQIYDSEWEVELRQRVRQLNKG